MFLKVKLIQKQSTKFKKRKVKKYEFSVHGQCEITKIAKTFDHRYLNVVPNF